MALTQLPFGVQLAGFATSVSVYTSPILLIAGTMIPAGQKRIIFGDPQASAPKPLGSFVRLPFAFGKIPDELEKPDAYLEFASRIPQTTPIRKARVGIQLFADQVNFEMAKILRKVGRGRNGESRNDLIAKAIEGLTGLSAFEHTLKIGFFLLCKSASPSGSLVPFGNPDGTSAILLNLSGAADVFWQQGDYISAAILFELAAEAMDYSYTLQAEGGEMERQTAVSSPTRAHHLATHSWLKAMEHTATPETADEILYRGLRNAARSFDGPTLGFSLLQESSSMYLDQRRLSDAADNFLRAAALYAGRPKLDADDYERIAISLFMAALLWKGINEREKLDGVIPLIAEARRRSEHHSQELPS